MTVWLAAMTFAGLAMSVTVGGTLIVYVPGEASVVSVSSVRLRRTTPYAAPCEAVSVPSDGEAVHVPDRDTGSLNVTSTVRESTNDAERATGARASSATVLPASPLPAASASGLGSGGAYVTLGANDVSSISPYVSVTVSPETVADEMEADRSSPTSLVSRADHSPGAVVPVTDSESVTVSDVVDTVRADSTDGAMESVASTDPPASLLSPMSVRPPDAGRVYVTVGVVVALPASYLSVSVSVGEAPGEVTARFLAPVTDHWAAAVVPLTISESVTVSEPAVVVLAMDRTGSMPSSATAFTVSATRRAAAEDRSVGSLASLSPDGLVYCIVGVADVEPMSPCVRVRLLAGEPAGISRGVPAVAVSPPAVMDVSSSVVPALDVTDQWPTSISPKKSVGLPSGFTSLTTVVVLVSVLGSRPTSNVREIDPVRTLPSSLTRMLVPAIPYSPRPVYTTSTLSGEERPLSATREWRSVMALTISSVASVGWPSLCSTSWQPGPVLMPSPAHMAGSTMVVAPPVPMPVTGRRVPSERPVAGFMAVSVTAQSPTRVVPPTACVKATRVSSDDILSMPSSAGGTAYVATEMVFLISARSPSPRIGEAGAGGPAGGK